MSFLFKSKDLKEGIKMKKALKKPKIIIQKIESAVAQYETCSCSADPGEGCKQCSPND